MNAPAPMNSINIRCSGLTYYPDCERRSAANLFRSIIEAQGYLLRTTSIHVGAPIGTGVHAGTAFGLQTKIDTGELSTLTDATEVALTGLDDALDEAKTDVQYQPGVAGNRDQAQKQVIRMTAMIHVKLSPGITPIAVEDRLEADIGDGFFLTGHRDIYAVEGSARSWRIKDLKTGVHLSKHMPQIGGYGILARSHGNRVDGADIVYLRRARLEDAQPEPIIAPVDIVKAERAAEATYKRAKSGLIAFMETGDPGMFLANPFSKLCNERCPAWGTQFCQEHLETE